jgi:hypothetical protein
MTIEVNGRCSASHIIYYLAVKGDIDISDIFDTSKSKSKLNENTRKRKSENDDDEDDESDDDDDDDDDDDHEAKNGKPILKNDEEINCFRNQMQIKVKG